MRSDHGRQAPPYASAGQTRRVTRPRYMHGDKWLRLVVQELVEAEAAWFTVAARYERTDGLLTERNGHQAKWDEPVASDRAAEGGRARTASARQLAEATR